VIALWTSESGEEVCLSNEGHITDANFLDRYFEIHPFSTIVPPPTYSASTSTSSGQSVLDQKTCDRTMRLLLRRAVNEHVGEVGQDKNTILLGLGDANAMIRQTVGAVVTGILSMEEPKSWPEALDAVTKGIVRTVLAQLGQSAKAALQISKARCNWCFEHTSARSSKSRARTCSTTLYPNSSDIPVTRPAKSDSTVSSRSNRFQFRTSPKAEQTRRRMSEEGSLARLKHASK
jgi:hypothetical protein